MLKLQRRKNSKNWYIRGTVRGQSIEESTGTDNRKAAEEIRVKREHELLQESIHGKQVTATFSQAALSYLRMGGEARFMKPVLLHFGDTKLNQISQQEIDAAARKLYPKAAPATINRQLHTVVSAVVSHASKRGWCEPLTLDRPAQPSGRVRWITKGESERLLQACTPHLRPLVLFLLYTGARCGEALWLQWKHIDLDRKHVTFYDTKNGTNRGVPLHSVLVSELASLQKKNTKSEYVFTVRGVPYKKIDSAGSAIKTAFTAAVKRAWLKDFRPHDLRHTWATWHYQANRDLSALQRLGGWKTTSMVLRYAHTNVQELACTIERI